MQQRLGEPLAPVGAWAAWRPRLPPAWTWLAATLEQERGRWLLWLPVALAVGIVGYFNLPGEPPAWSGWVAAGIGLMLVALAYPAWRGQVAGREALLIGLAAAALGFALAQARLHAVAAPVLERPRVYAVEGRVIDLAPRPGGDRLLLDRVVLAGVPVEGTPANVRVNLRTTPEGLLPGDRVRLRARLQPPLGPALPGGFDFARQAWFERLGAIGFAIGPAERLPAPSDGPALAIAELRASIAKRITTISPGSAGAMAAALVAGVRAGIDQATWRAMQISGLAHIISVSGLHMVLVAGSVFTVCRWLLALCPPLALRFPVKKLAAGVALAAAAFYLVLSGASVPTQRSFLMTAVALLAVMADRNPFSLRLLAWSALAVLVLRPESVLGASFQLSFAAVLALMVVYQGWSRRVLDDDAAEPGGLAPVWRYLLGVSVTTLVASAATTPLAAFHFQTIPTYGVLANLVAVPLTTFLVMPAGMIGLLLMPLGLDGPVFQVMAWGVEGVLWTARTAAALPGASILVHQWPGTALAMLAFGGLWLALWERRWRWLGLLPCAGALVLVLASRPPDLLVDRALGMAAVRHPTDATTLIEWRRDRLVRETWLRHLGTAEPLPAPKPGRGAVRGIGCDHAGCIVELGQLRVSLARDAEAAVEDCGRVDLVIARAGPESCRDGGAMVGPWELRGSGGLAISRDGGRLLVRSVAAHRGDWPWARARVGVQSRRLNLSE